MKELLDSGLLTDAGALVGFVVLVGYVGKMVIEFFRGQKSIETDWRTKTLQDAMLGHEALQRMFTILNERVENLEDDLRESKAREAEMIAAHRQEIEDIKYKYTVRIQELEAEISALKVRLTRSEGAA